MAKLIVWAFTLLIFSASPVFSDDLDNRIEYEVDACVYHYARLAKPYLIEKIPQQELYYLVSALSKPAWMKQLLKESRKKDSLQLWKGLAAFCEKDKTNAIGIAKLINLWLGRKRKPSGGIYASKAFGNTLETKVEREIIEPCTYQIALTLKSLLLEGADDPAHLWRLAQFRAKDVRKMILDLLRKEHAKSVDYYPGESYRFRVFFIRYCLAPKMRKGWAKPVADHLNDMSKKRGEEKETARKNISLWGKHCHLKSAKCENLSRSAWYQCAGRKSDGCVKLTKEIVRYFKKRDEEHGQYRQGMSKEERRKSLATDIGLIKKSWTEEKKLCARAVLDKLIKADGADPSKGEVPEDTTDSKYFRRLRKCTKMKTVSEIFLSGLQPGIDHYMKSLSPDEQRKEKKVLQPMLVSIKYLDAQEKCYKELERLYRKPGPDPSRNISKRNSHSRRCILLSDSTDERMETLKRKIHEIHRHYAGTAATWRGIRVAHEDRCSPYVRKHYNYPASIERRIIRRMGDRIYGPYTGRTFTSMRQTDIEHIVATSEAYDSGMCAADEITRKQFARDLDNLTLASPKVNRCSPVGKCGKDAAEWMPEKNKCWFANRIVHVRNKWDLTIDRKEADALEKILSGCESTDMVFHSDAK